MGCLYTKQDISSIWSCLTSKTSVGDDTPPSKKSKKLLCEFEGESVFNKLIFTRNDLKNPVTEQPDNMTCDECNKYAYKGPGGEYHDLTYDKELQADGAVVGVCTAKFAETSSPL